MPSKKLDKFETNKWYNRDRPPMQYVDPNIGLYNPEMMEPGTTYVAPSLAPKEVLADPNATLPADRYPVDWSLTSEAGTDESTEERNQRAIVRDYLAQKYGKAADLGGVEAAMKRGERENLMADVGYGLDRMFMAQSAARGGPGADAGYWQAKKREAAGRVEEAEGLRQAKIKDYLMQKNLGQQGVEELQKMRKFDIENASNDPNSQISRSYQNAFGAMYPDETKQMLGDLQKMSANEIKDIAGMYGKKAQMDLQRIVELGKLGYMETMANAPARVDQSKADLDAARADYWTQKANQLRQTAEAPIAGRNQIQKTPKAQLEEDLLRARIKTEEAKVKPKESKTDFESDKRFVATALKELSEANRYERAREDSLKSYDEGASYSMYEGFVPGVSIGGKNITGGKRSEYDAYIAKLGSMIIEQVPGIRSDSDFRNLVMPMLPKPGDTPDIVQKKKKIFSDWLDSRRPETATYDMLPAADQEKVGVLATKQQPKFRVGQIIIQDGKKYKWDGKKAVPVGGE